MPPENYELQAFHQVYTADVLNRMALKAEDDEGLRSLHLMLTSNTEHFWIKRIHIDKCLTFAMEHGCLDEDRRNRLTNLDSYHVWLSTYYELLVPYFFARVFSKKIQCVASPSKRGLGDFKVIHPEGNIVVEVKTPKGDDAFSNGQKHAEYNGYGDEFINSVFKGAAKQL